MLSASPGLDIELDLAALRAREFARLDARGLAYPRAVAVIASFAE